MPEPRVVNQGPHRVELKAGRTYFWCSCGSSRRQPFCDGSHAGTKFSPVRFAAPEDCATVLCGCKRTATGPFCDRAHDNLSAAVSC